jgi:hypothetical protein
MQIVASPSGRSSIGVNLTPIEARERAPTGA